MPESYGKRQKDTKKARKFAAREERRAARKRERENPGAGAPEEGAPDQATDELVPPEGDAGSPTPPDPGGSGEPAE